MWFLTNDSHLSLMSWTKKHIFIHSFHNEFQLYQMMSNDGPSLMFQMMVHHAYPSDGNKYYCIKHRYNDRHTENLESSWCQLCPQKWYCRMALKQSVVPPVMIKLASWQLLVFIAQPFTFSAPLSTNHHQAMEGFNHPFILIWGVDCLLPSLGDY